MLTLSNGTFTEDFSYNGLSPTGQVQVRPWEFDYSGTVVTNRGVVSCPQQTFTMHGGDWGDWKNDTALPYGGPPSSNNTYIRFPVLSWGQAAGMFLNVQTTAASVLTFDRSFSGYVGDVFSVMVNDVERMTITGSAGYPWTRTSIALGRGKWTIAFVLSTAKYLGQTAIIREGVAQGSASITELQRYLRMTNISVTNVATLPVARNSQALLQARVTTTSVGSVKVTSGKLTLKGVATLKVPVKTSPPVTMQGTSTLVAPNAFVGKQGKATWQAAASFTSAFTLSPHHVGDVGGFGMTAHASLTVDSTVPEQSSTLLRPLRRTSFVMSSPTIIGGAPTTPLADCTTEVITNCTAAQYVRRVDPHSPANVAPVTPTWRWLSVDAQSDATSNQLTQWHPTAFDGPVWSTPGDYRPAIGDFSIRIAGSMTKVPYPSVQFDAGHLDHLTTALPDVAADGTMTWVFVGGFARWRGAVPDNCPIIDYAADNPIDYQPDTEYVADRGNYMPWTDPSTSKSIYLGLTGYSDKDLTSSQFAVRTNDATNTFARTSDLVISDATPVVLIYRITSKAAVVSVMPLVAGQIGSSTSIISRVTNTGKQRTFCLGKSRVNPPFGGSFLTGSMSLLEVSYYPRAITDAETTSLQNFYSALYGPVAGGVVEPDYTRGALNVGSEQVLLYAADPETPLTLLSGNKMVVLSVYPSTALGRVEMDRFNAQGVPIVQVSNRDYARLIANMVGEGT